MPNKCLNVHQYSDVIMGNRDTDNHEFDITEETIIDNNYESVVVSKNNIDETNKIVQEIFDPEFTTSHDVWNVNEIRYLIYCWNQLREQFANCKDKKKKTLWELISERMVERGFYFDAVACESKWRFLKKMYMYNKTQLTKKDGSKHAIVWAHYNDMDKAIKGISYTISEDELNYSITTVNECENTYPTIGEKNVNKYQWTHNSTKDLIQLYSKNRNLLTSVIQGGKHLLWEKIAKQMSQLGYQYSANMCNDKWRNLKMTYKKNKLKELNCEVDLIKWPYYKDMDDIFKILPQESHYVNNVITLSLTENNELEEIKNDDVFDDSIEVQKSNIINPEEQNIGNNYGEGTSCTQEIWTEEATKCLIDLWGHYRSRFIMAAQGKKRVLWNEISEQLRLNGYNYSGLVCDRKWRLLKANYLKRKEKYRKQGMGSVKWQYYYDMDRLLGSPIDNVSWCMNSTMNLIECFNNHKEKFIKALTGEKLLIWKNISDQMAQNGYSYTARACDNKWRTLKNRYYKNRTRANRNKKVAWIYYNKIDSIIREIEKEKDVKINVTNNCDINSQTCEEIDEHNYIKTNKPDCSFKINAITELKDRMKLKDVEYDQRIKEMEDTLRNRERKFELLHQQTLDAINRSNELEDRKIKLLEQLVSRLPHTL